MNPAPRPRGGERVTPLLGPDQRALALARLDGISRALRRAKLPADASLAGGLAGRVLAHAALEPLFPGRGHGRAAERARLRALEHVGAQQNGLGLFTGLAGVVWLDGARRWSHESGLPAAFDAWLTDVLARPWPGRFELTEGLVGLAVALLPRAHEPAARAALALVVARLADASQLGPDGRTWPTFRAHLPAHVQEQHVDGEIDLGAAHGLPGVLAVLAQAAAAGVEPAEQLATEGFAYLRTQVGPSDATALLPSLVVHGRPEGWPRPTWCYGDVGAALCLWHGGAALGAPSWQRLALVAARRAASVPVERAGVHDAGLCHGAAGIAHAFHRLARATGDAQCLAAARRWFDAALAMRWRVGGVAGYAARVPGPEGRPAWAPRLGYLDGVSGVALALAQAVTGELGVWDQPLLMAPLVPPLEARLVPAESGS